jgi:hypothetical protein
MSDTMNAQSNRKSWIIPFTLAAIWLVLSYVARYQLMEDARWLDICSATTGNSWCEVRAGLGLTIHRQILPYLALLLAVPAFFVRGSNGRRLAWASLIFGLPALALYTVTLAVFAVLLAALRIVRIERHNENASASVTTTQPSA